MAEVVGLAQVESELMRLSGMLEKATHAIRQRAEAAADADTTYDIAFSKAFLLAKEDGLTDPSCKAQALVLCANELTLRNATQALYESAREAARNYRCQLDALRSINSNVRALTVAGA
jgi:hypothetical protein